MRPVGRLDGMAQASFELESERGDLPDLRINDTFSQARCLVPGRSFNSPLESSLQLQAT